ncbi:hypothetical protein OG874_38665 [Nocardia sp. NBC_00565]|uniref:hypothetical protein n=1 Tax=Nocardia sp. NBC_00565 TaxID=2975993 RepID=UPI002E816F89|nr:hypothetical protein [Nocardia sp. NBC_00565]WUC02575.1 hypothetical protein OG874_38665 [Nocardia sp. NBC_00565]
MSAFGEGPDVTIEILNIVPMQGPGGIVAASCDAAISLTVDEINTGAGFLGREIRTTNIDGGRDRLARYRRLHGNFAPALTSFSNMSYQAIHTLRAIAQTVGSLQVPEVHAVLDQGVLLETPGGTRGFLGNQAQQHGYIALADGVDFDIIAKIT